MRIRARVLVGNKVTVMFFNNTFELIRAQLSGLTVLEVVR